MGLDRRHLVLGAGVLALLPAVRSFAAETLEDIKDLKPGEFTWHPERQKKGPVAIIVSLPQQRVHVYRNGVRIAVSTCSSGKPGHETPTGIFVILQKDKDHKSSTYNDAPMPNMNRLTWSGIALHAGNLPGYPASHGCVRLPLAFSSNLFGITHIGTPVIISGARGDPAELTNPGMVLVGCAAGQFQNVVASKDGHKRAADWVEPEDFPVTSIIASSGDKQIMLIENGVVVAQAPLTITGSGGLGSHVLTLQVAGAANDWQWVDISRSASSGSFFNSEQDMLKRLSTQRSFLDAMQARMHPGMVMVLTDAPLHPDSRSGQDFVVMSAPD